MISFHGETVKDLRNCEQHGVRPEKPASGRILLRTSPEVHGAGLVAAQTAGTSLNQRAAEVIEGAAHS
jgi:predicted HicB family RNase H-like nuclease